MESDGVRTTLANEREKLIRQLDELGATESGDLRPDLEFGDGFADAGAATAERTEVLGLVESLKGQLASVDKAIVKVEDGTYGSCDNCGQPIPPARLEARPSSVLCIDCKNQQR
jgi:DnaK suppressor protein